MLNYLKAKYNIKSKYILWISKLYLFNISFDVYAQKYFSKGVIISIKFRDIFKYKTFKKIGFSVFFYF
jgi:hypothetical protein